MNNRLCFFIQGPYTLIVKKVYSCNPDEDYPMFQDVRISHFNPQRPKENQTVSMKFNMKETVDDKCWVSSPIENS